MKSFKFDKLLLIILLVPTVSSLIISSVYAGKKKFKTFSFGKHLPTLVKVSPNRLHLTFRQNKYLRTPEFKIEGTLPLKAPTIIKEIFYPDPEPEVTEYNIGSFGASHGETEPQPVYMSSNHHESIAMGEEQQLRRFQSNPSLPHSTSPQFESTNNLQTFINQPLIQNSNQFNRHRVMKRSANDYDNQFHSESQNPYFNGNYGPNLQIPPQTLPNVNNYQIYDNDQQKYESPQNGQNYFNPNNAHNSHLHNPNLGKSPLNNYELTHNNPNMYPNFHNNRVYQQNSQSFVPQKYHKVFVTPDSQNSGWTPITNGHNNYMPNNQNNHNHNNQDAGHPSNRVPIILPNYGNAAEDSKKVNIGEHYNPSASYLDETVAAKPTYDPDEGSVSFSISGPHGGEKVPFGYEDRIRAHHEQLKKFPDRLPDGLDIHQLMKYYHHLTFVDGLKSDYGYVESSGPLGFIKNKLSSLKKLLPV